MTLIKQEDAIEEIESAWEDDESTILIAGLACAKGIIASLPSVDADWIPVSERLPNEGGFYLCTTEDCVTILEFVTGNYHYNESPSFVSDTLGRCNGYVIAWMPLPKPYKGGDTE